MKRTFAIAASVMILGAACAKSAPAPQPVQPQPLVAAQAGLLTLRKMITDQNYRQMGFESRNDVNNAAVDPRPFQIYAVPLDKLKAYQPGSDPAALLRPATEALYAVTVNGVVRSAITVSEVTGGFKASGFGKAPVIRELSRYRTPTSFVVWVPAFNQYYVGDRTTTGLQLTAIKDDARLSLRAGISVPARDVFDRLSPMANVLRDDVPA